MPLRDAACLIGRRLPDWQDSDIEQCALDRSDSADLEAWDRTDYAQAQLTAWTANGIIPAYGEDGEGRRDAIEAKWLTTPYFRLDILSSRFLVFPDLWAAIVVDGPALQAKLAGVRSLKPRQAQTYEWQPIVNRAWMIALALDPPRTQAAIVARLEQWYLDGPGEGTASPDGKELKALARTIVAYLGDRRLVREVLPPETSPDEEAGTG
jgi:hypothetical protein